MFGLNPWVLLGTGVAIVLIALAAYLSGVHNANVACDLRVSKIYADAAEKVKAQEEAERAKANTASTTLETKAAEAKVIYRTITRNVDRVVEKPIYKSVCLETDGLALVNAALAGLPVQLPPQALTGPQ